MIGMINHWECNVETILSNYTVELDEGLTDSIGMF
jgi:hypothetical protein